MTESRPTLDVSHLPPIAFDRRAPSWWGNVLFMTIETTTVALLVVSYFYSKQNFPEWPPPRSDSPTGSHDNLPGLWFATANTLLLLASCVPMVLVDRAARRGDSPAVKRGLLLLTTLGIVSIVLRCCEFPSLKFRWDDNAYASLIWAIVFLHLTYLVVATVEVAVNGAWIFIYEMGENLADDVTLTGDYWYWMVGLWLPLYATIYWAPRIL